MEIKRAQILSSDLLRAEFVMLGLHMVAYEMRVRATKEPLHAFFADEWTAENGWKISNEYRRKVLAQDIGSQSGIY